MLLYGAHLIIYYIDSIHKFYVKSTQVDGIVGIKIIPPPKKIKIRVLFISIIPPRIIAGIVKIVIVSREAVHLPLTPPGCGGGKGRGGVWGPLGGGF
jgi:hypothetical protein